MPDLHWKLPLKVDSYGLYLLDADSNMIVQLRGWGHLTGPGGLSLEYDAAAAIQKARGEYIAAAVSAFMAAQADPPDAATVDRSVRVLERHGQTQGKDFQDIVAVLRAHVDELARLSGKA